MGRDFLFLCPKQRARIFLLLPHTDLSQVCWRGNTASPHSPQGQEIRTTRAVSIGRTKTRLRFPYIHIKQQTMKSCIITACNLPYSNVTKAKEKMTEFIIYHTKKTYWKRMQSPTPSSSKLNGRKCWASRFSLFTHEELPPVASEQGFEHYLCVRQIPVRPWIRHSLTDLLQF
jgi:hypothetical protein